MSNDDIRMAQVEAGEAAVVQRLRDKGLLPPEQPTQSGRDECEFIHKLVSGNVRCGCLREHHSQYTGHVFTEPPPPEQPAPEGESWEYVEDTYHRPSVRIGKVELTPHWEGLRTADEIRRTLRQAVADHRLAALVPELVEALGDVLTDLSAMDGRAKQRHEYAFKLLTAARKAGIE